MRSDSLPTRDPLEAAILRARPRAEEIFRRHGLSPEVAREVLLEGLQWLESPHGVVPGASHRLLKCLDAASRRLASEPGATMTVDGNYRTVIEEVIGLVQRRRRDSRREAESFTEWCAAADWTETAVAEVASKDPQLSKHAIVALLDRAKLLWRSDPTHSLNLARQALDLIPELPADSLEIRFVADLEARGHTYAGNALRLLYDYRSAERAFEAAQAALARGTNDPRERAQMLMQLATLRRDQRRFAEALSHFQQAAAIYRWSRERHDEGLIHLLMATTQAYANRPELSVPLAERARELIDGERDPRMKAAVEMNMAHYLQAAGRIEEAHARIPEARRLMEATGTKNDLRNLRWIEGRIALALGEREKAEELMVGVRNELVELGDTYDAALVSLELVAAYLDQGRAADAKRLAAESLPIFQSLEIHRETLAALIALQRATELETASAGVVRELLERLRRGNAASPPRPEKPS